MGEFASITGLVLASAMAITVLMTSSLAEANVTAIPGRCTDDVEFYQDCFLCGRMTDEARIFYECCEELEAIVAFCSHLLHGIPASPADTTISRTSESSPSDSTGDHDLV
jgi:hypothetical protein